MITLKQGGSLLLLALLSLPSQKLNAAPPEFAIDVKELDQRDRQKPAVPKKTEPAKKAPASFDLDVKELDRRKPAAASQPEKKKAKKVQKAEKKASASAASGKARTSAEGAVPYTVKPGDHIFKILMGPFGMSNEAAECLIPEVIRINKIENIKKLRVGQTLLIPRKGDAERGETPSDKEKGEKAAPAPVPRPAPAPVAPAPAAPVAPALPETSPLAAPPRPVPAPAATTAVTWVCSVIEREPAKMVDAVLNALSVSWSKNKIVQSEDGAATAFSIRVDRYFEYKGGRYIVSIGESDPYSYTLLRILESAGYRVLRVNGGEDFNGVAEKLLKLMGVVPEYGKHALQEGKDAAGFLVQPDDAGGKRVVLTGDRVDPRQKWLMKPGCTAR